MQRTHELRSSGPAAMGRRAARASARSRSPSGVRAGSRPSGGSTTIATCRDGADRT